MTNRYLPTALRRTLEKTIKDARIIAEEGAGDAIQRLGVADGKAPSYLNDAEKELRRRLRAHARALGDAFDKSDETQETKRLVEAAAYAHWHRMLFARFLAERGLLRNPEYDVPVSLEDCRELAEAEGLTDAWAIAERYAASMLPAVFRIDDPVLALDLDPVHTQKLHRLVTGLDAEVFQAEDSLGWTYQFWRAAEKDAVNKSGVKIGADELPAVTQLFTEPYMVRFLLHNTLGAWWAGKMLGADPTLAQTATDEDALRAACSLPNYSFDMLRFVREGEDGPWRPAAGTFPGWPTDAKAITMLDPCCGSGHFLTEVLAILAALRQAEERLSPADAIAEVLRDNLYGLEIDGRCVQIAAFAVALTGWRIGGWQQLPLPRISWVGAPPPLPKQEFIGLAEGEVRLEAALAALHNIFSQAPLLGSLIEPRASSLFDAENYRIIAPLLDKILDRARKGEPEYAEGAIAARGMADAAEVIFNQYTLVCTNFPFLGLEKQDTTLSRYISDHLPESKRDLATAFADRAVRFIEEGGATAFVGPGEWTFLRPYRHFRAHYLSLMDIKTIARIGKSAFSTSLRVMPVLCISEHRSTSGTAHVIDVREYQFEEKEASLKVSGPIRYQIDDWRSSHEARLFVEESTRGIERLSVYAEAKTGMSAGDGDRFERSYWEVLFPSKDWELLQSSPNDRDWLSGKYKAIFWQNETGDIFKLAESVKHLNHSAQNWQRGRPFWGRLGVIIGKMGGTAIYAGEMFDSSALVVVPKREEYLGGILSFFLSGGYRTELAKIDDSFAFGSPKVATQVIYNPEEWISGATEFERIALGPSTDDPTNWLFSGHPRAAKGGTVLHVCLARLAGYRWPAESHPRVRLSSEARDWIAKLDLLPSSDKDGLIGIPPVAGEKSLADRLRAHLAAAFGTEWSDALERRLVAEADEALDKKAARDGSLEAWLRDRAFRQHCALFGQRPFLWQISDGLKDGFSVFVYYHRFDLAALRKLTYTLLGDWLARAKAEGNTLRYEKGRELQQKLEKILEGEKPFDIFVRWKSLAQQPLGWDPDLDDGVRQNIRPFIKAGVLTHDLSKILKDKDRGNDVPSAPWYDVFNGERRNDHHTTLAEKRAAREAAAKRVEAAK